MKYAATCLLALLASCGPSADGGDAAACRSASCDAGRRDDAGLREDAGPHDAGPHDAGPGEDASARDASADDAGDAAPVDAGPEVCGVTRRDSSSAPSGASWRYGGGHGYPDMVPPDGPCTTLVRTRSELEAALAIALPDSVVYVADDARIGLDGASLCIPAGVTLASGRGRGGSAGALLHITETESRATLRACGDDVRVTGLRLHGWEPTECPPEWPDRCEGVDRTGGVNCRDCMPRSRGIQAAGVDRLEVDNCELTGWTYGAIELRDSLENHVHHSHIHHNRRQGLGYGVVVSNVTDPATVLVEHNRFAFNRHSIAGSGAVGQSYEARNNLVLPGANGHVFDMHGIDEATDDGTPWAGTEMLVHDNTVLVDSHYALVVRGRPTEGAWLWSNCLARSSASTAALQRHYTGNFSVDRSPTGAAPNAYGQSAADCETVRFCASPGGAGPARYLAASSYGLSALRFGDFDGDGTTDVFRADGSAWWWLAGGGGGWTRLNTSTTPASELAFGDFDGDGRTDVFRATGSEWRWSRSGSSAWAALATRTESLSELAFGDFDGDGRTDAFRADGTAFWVASGASGAWTRVNTSSYTLASLAFGDFDGDGRTDVFRADGAEWTYSQAGSTPWMRLNASSSRVASLAFGDFDGDGRTDVLRPDGTRWNVSFGARGGWQTLAVESEALPSIALGDFDGDGRTDVFRTGCL